MVCKSHCVLFVFVGYFCSVNSKLCKTNAQADFMVTLTKVLKIKDNLHCVSSMMVNQNH